MMAMALRTFFSEGGGGGGREGAGHFYKFKDINSSKQIRLEAVNVGITTTDTGGKVTGVCLAFRHLKC